MFFINPSSPYPYNQAGSSGPQGGSTSNVYVLNIPEIEMVDLLPIGRTELAKIADSVRFYINYWCSFLVTRMKNLLGYIGEHLRKETIPREGLHKKCKNP